MIIMIITHQHYDDHSPGNLEVWHLLWTHSQLPSNRLKCHSKIRKKGHRCPAAYQSNDMVNAYTIAIFIKFKFLTIHVILVPLIPNNIKNMINSICFQWNIQCPLYLVNLEERCVNLKTQHGSPPTVLPQSTFESSIPEQKVLQYKIYLNNKFCNTKYT